jgi:hypothetical protein
MRQNRGLSQGFSDLHRLFELRCIPGQPLFWQKKALKFKREIRGLNYVQ